MNVKDSQTRIKILFFSDLIESMQISENPFLVGLFPEQLGQARKKDQQLQVSKLKSNLKILFKTMEL